jgi:RNA polymerase sigma factor (sigma-70 family)
MADRFDTTRWSLILHAAGSGNGARAALETLCRTYRPAVLAYVRAHRRQRDDAEDLTQSFFAHLLEQRLAERADPERGRFRAFLLTSLKHFLASQYARASTQRRGGGTDALPLEEFDPADDDGPEQAFEREWAQAVLGEALARLHAEACRAEKEALFLRLRPFLLEMPDEDEYAAVAEAFGLRRNTLAVAVHRLRARLQDLVHQVVADTVDGRAEADAELRRLRTRFTTVASAPVIAG